MTASRYVCVMGPTAVGKTALAVWLHRAGGTELISVDSAMVYRGLDIGSGKPDAVTLAEAPHRLIDIRDPSDVYSAADFAVDARREITAITAAGRLPLLVGGTGLYFRALREGFSLLPPANAEVRAALEEEARGHGWEALHARLASVDPDAARRIHPSDRQRIQRALEVYELTGASMTALQEQPRSGGGQSEDVLVLILVPSERKALHETIAKRFDQMLSLGLVDEVARLRARGDLHRDLPAMRAVGYRQVWDYLDGNVGYAEMCEKAVAATRQLARRQLTWLRSISDAVVLEIDLSGLEGANALGGVARTAARHIDHWCG